MKPKLKSEIEQKEFCKQARLHTVVEQVHPPPIRQSVLTKLGRLVLKLNSALAMNSSKFGEAEWRRLEYRNEMPTREAERMNHFGIR